MTFSEQGFRNVLQLVIVMGGLSFLTPVVADAQPDPHELVRRCFEREAHFESGHIEFHLDLTDPDNPALDSAGEYYFEWAPSDKIRFGNRGENVGFHPKFRFGNRGDDAGFIAIGDGEHVYTEDGFLWPMYIFRDPYVSPQEFDVPVADSTILAWVVCDTLQYRILHPLKSDSWRDIAHYFAKSDPVRIPYEPESASWRWLGKDHMAADVAGTLALLGIGGTAYALDVDRAMPVRMFRRPENNTENLPDSYWKNPYEVEPGVSLARNYTGWSRVKIGATEMVLEVFPDTTWLGDVPPDRFVIPENPDVKHIGWLYKRGFFESYRDASQIGVVDPNQETYLRDFYVREELYLFWAVAIGLPLTGLVIAGGTLRRKHRSGEEKDRMSDRGE